MWFCIEVINFQYCHGLNTKLMVFRRGMGYWKNMRNVFLKVKLEVVSFYKYLGLMFTLKLRWTLSRKTIASQAEKALHLLYMYNSKCGSLSLNIQCLICSIKLYCLYYCTVWVTDWSDVIENVHISFCKRILHVNSSTPNAAVLMESVDILLLYTITPFVQNIG